MDEIPAAIILTLAGFAERIPKGFPRIVNGKPIETLFGGQATDDDGPYPEIEFMWKGSIHKFVSRYGGSGIPQVGSEIDVVFDPATGSAEHLSVTNRWLGTVVPLIFSALFFWV